MTGGEAFRQSSAVAAGSGTEGNPLRAHPGICKDSSSDADTREEVYATYSVAAPQVTLVVSPVRLSKGSLCSCPALGPTWLLLNGYFSRHWTPVSEYLGERTERDVSSLAEGLICEPLRGEVL